MSRAAVESLIDRWMNEPDFRAALRQDAEAAVRTSGVDLSAEEWDAVRQIDWNLSDEELQTRINAFGS
ncbi:MAG: Os1348 family NHLP clan protein [Candidatus Binataceae bacterium]